MAVRDLEKQVFDNISLGDWPKAIAAAKMMPSNYNIFSRMPPSAEMPDSAIKSAIDEMSNPKSRHREDFSNFLFELSSNLPENASPEILNYILNHTKEDYLTTNNVQNHPNYKPDADSLSRMEAAKWWNDYESKVKPHHFATIKSMITGKHEKVKTHRGETGESDPNIIPHLLQHKENIKNAILNDRSIPKKIIRGVPHIQVYRGVGGEYGNKIREGVEFDPETNTFNGKKVRIPIASMASWSINPEVAGRFAHARGTLDDKHPKAGVVIKKWLPIEDVLHSGFHQSVAGQPHAHTHEEEIVFKHPEGKILINPSEITVQGKDSEYGHTIKPKRRNLSKSEFEILEKGRVKDFVTAATVATMLGFPTSTVAPNISFSQMQQVPITKISAPKNISNKDLKYISYIESSGGLNVNHPKVKHGINKGTNAIGQYGLMPLQILDTLKYDKKLGNKYKEIKNMDYLKDQNKINDFIQNNPQFEEEVAQSHWNRLNKKFNGNKNKMAYAWFNGITGTMKASPEEINNHWYVKKFNNAKKMFDLEDKVNVAGNDDFNKAELGSENISHLSPIFDDNVSKNVIEHINVLIDNEQVHKLSNFGHFTEHSVVVGFENNDSFLIKIESTNVSSVDMVGGLLQSTCEAAFYECAKKVFKLQDYTPLSILAQVKQENELWPCAAIKMYDNAFIPAKELKDNTTFRNIMYVLTKTGITHKLGAMMYVLGDIDCHAGNVLVGYDTIKLIDHGSSFADGDIDVVNDHNIFIPYFMRYLGVDDNMSPNEKLSKMPKISDFNILNDLKTFIMSIDFHDLANILTKYGIETKSCIKRLQMLQSGCRMGNSADYVVNAAWTIGLNK